MSSKYYNYKFNAKTNTSVLTESGTQYKEICKLNKLTMCNVYSFATVKHDRGVSETQKKRVASSQLWMCGICDVTLDETYEIDHIQSLATGGSNEDMNLQALCRLCHGKKTINVEPTTTSTLACESIPVTTSDTVLESPKIKNVIIK